MDVITNLKYIVGLIVILNLQVSLQNSVKCPSDAFKTAEEVVSIYGGGFDTPKSREPYFIQINRCVIDRNSRDNPLWDDCPKCWSVPTSREEIEIVVPDLEKSGKFYRYVVYNDTACKCGNRTEVQHKNFTRESISNEISEEYFKKKLANNPVNVRSCKRSYCSKAQPRYQINEEGELAHPFDRYILYHQCLPGCHSKTQFNKSDGPFYRVGNSGMYSIVLKRNDMGCWPYQQGVADVGHLPQAMTKQYPRSPDRQQEAHVTVSQNGMIIYVDSTKLLLAAFVLSAIILLILLVDCNLWSRKKGLLYSILCCKKHRQERDCEICAERRINMTEV